MKICGPPTVIHNGIHYTLACNQGIDNSQIINLDAGYTVTNRDDAIIINQENNFEKLYDIIEKLSYRDSFQSQELDKIFEYSILNNKMFEQLIIKMISFENLDAYRRIIDCLSINNYDLAMRLLGHKYANLDDVFTYLLKNSMLDRDDIPNEFKNTFLSYLNPLEDCNEMKIQGLYSKYAYNYFKKHTTMEMLMKHNKDMRDTLISNIEAIAEKISSL